MNIIYIYYSVAFQAKCNIKAQSIQQSLPELYVEAFTMCETKFYNSL